MEHAKKHSANSKTIAQREKQKVNRAGQETKNITMETKS